MGWKERSGMGERLLLVSECMKGEVPMAGLCQDFGISRKTAYKWLSRYQEHGPGGLDDRSRAPITHPQRVDAVVAEALLMARRSHPHWGARKILAWLAAKQPHLKLPVASTVSALFVKYGLTRRRQARRRTPPHTDPFADADMPNRVWCADFKGALRRAITNDAIRSRLRTRTVARCSGARRCIPPKPLACSRSSKRPFGSLGFRSGFGPITERRSRAAAPVACRNCRFGG